MPLLHSRNRSLIVIFVLSVFILTAAFPMGVFASGSPSTYTVTVGGDLPHPGGESMYMGYGPSVMVIRAGDTIVWKALDGPHTVTSENLTADGKPLFDSNPKVSFPLPAFIFGPGGFIPPGGTYVLDTSKLKPGTYGILCSIHQDSGMQATLTITNQAAPQGYTFPVVTGVSSGNTEVEEFNPQNITVPMGTKVLFENLSGFEVHTVVSVVTLPNGTRVLGTVFDSSPLVTPPGITWDQVPQANMEGVTALGGAMFPIPGMDTFSYTFNNPGTYLYYCKYHSAVESRNIAGMVGEVIVLPPYATNSDLSNMSTANAQLTSQLATATSLAIGGVVLGIIGIVMAILAMRKRPAKTN